MATKFFTNKNNTSLLDKFAAVFEHNKQITEFDALVGYFRSSGYFHLRPHLEDLDQIRILVGIDVDRWTAQAKNVGLSFEFGADRDQVIQDYMGQFKKEVEDTDYLADIEKSILQFVEDIKTEKIVLRAHPSRKLHAKIYIFRPKPFNEHTAGEVITGSSNFTQAGLGVKENDSNYEFNVSLRDYEDIKFATDEFEALWKESVEILPEHAQQVIDQSYLRVDITSFDIYIKLLIEYFGKEIEFDPNSVSDIPPGWRRLNYQMDAVEQGYLMLQNHNGFFLSDVVGLGKTVIATMIARKYFYMNDYPEYRSRTLVVCPPAVKDNWDETIKQFDLDNVTVITNGSLHKVEDSKQYDLVIVDEAHKFRNDNTFGYATLQSICKNPCRNGKPKRVILVSATALNNEPADIRNQVLLFQDANYSTLDVNLARFFIDKEKEYDEIIRIPEQPDNPRSKKVEKLYADIRNKVIEPLTVRRTRTDLMEHDLYSKDLEKQGIVFPEITPPENLLYQMDEKLNSLYEESFTCICNENGKGLQYACFRLIEHLKPKHKEDYQRPDFFIGQLVGIMKTLLIKRLDSSFYAFHQSLERFVKSYAAAIKMFEDNRIYIAPDVDIKEYILEEREDDLLNKLNLDSQTDPRIKKLTRDDFDDLKIEELLRHDHQLLTALAAQWRQVTEQHPDPKLQLLLEELPKNLLSKKRNPEQKLVIFSESADTTAYLAEKLQQQGHKVLSVTGISRSKQRDAIRQNFDANLDPDMQKAEYDIIVSTESLAEGVNLHRANSIVNYDTPWNSIRLMQRIGRINRIGSQSQKIYIYNFFPTDQVNKDIDLKSRAQVKLHAFHVALGEDSQIYSTDENPQTFGLFDSNIAENKDISERLAYLMEIRRYRDKNPDEFKRIKDLPLKIRNAVEDKELSDNAICFLRNDRHNSFYRVSANDQVEEMGFLEVAPIFKRNGEAKPKPLPESHHEQVRSALKYFETYQEDIIIQEQQAPELTPQQRRAVWYMKSLLGTDNIVNEEEKAIIQQAMNWVTRGRSQNLTRDIVRLDRSQKKAPVVPSKQLEKLLEIIKRHAPSITPEESAEPAITSDIVEPAHIVISQNYLKPKRGGKS